MLCTYSYKWIGHRGPTKKNSGLWCMEDHVLCSLMPDMILPILYWESQAFSHMCECISPINGVQLELELQPRLRPGIKILPLLESPAAGTFILPLMPCGGSSVPRIKIRTTIKYSTYSTNMLLRMGNVILSFFDHWSPTQCYCTLNAKIELILQLYTLYNN